MASALSDDEFHRLQLQLLDLRTVNYELDGKSKKLEREVAGYQERCEALDKELAKANKVINKSKKTKEVELLIQENDGLQAKLHSQEEEFRLQNQTLMQELSSLVASNEQFEKEVAELKEGSFDNKGNNSALEDEIRRLQAENLVLQKNINLQKEKPDPNSDNLLLTDREPPTGDEERKVEGSDKPDDLTHNSENSNNIEKLTEDISKLKINLDTEREEKKILKDELNNMEKKLRKEIGSLQSETEKLNEKFKRKQESYLAIQKEKEVLFADNSKKVEEIQAGRDRDQKYYQDINNKLQKEIDKLKQEGETEKNSALSKIQELEQTISGLQTQVNAASIVGNQQLEEQTHKYQNEIVELRKQMTKLLQENDDFKVQLQESQKAASQTIEQLNGCQHERDLQIQSLQEISKVAESRKSILDELAIKYQKEIDSHRETTAKTEEKHQTKITSLTQDISNLNEKVVELEKQKILFEELQTTHKSINDTKNWLERRLKETEENLEHTSSEYEATINELKSSHEAQITKTQENQKLESNRLLEEQHTWRIEWEEKENQLQQENENLQTAISSLRQEIKDGVGDKKIHEKKGLTMIKDLKRQLHTERKRSEKLQERLQEILTDSGKDRQSMEDLFRPTDPNDMFGCDNSSVSSWSASASGKLDSNLSGPQSPTSTNKSLSEDVEQEYGDLLTRMGGMQEASWALEEKVAHLEMSNGCMADDLLRKTAIIEHYVMESRPDHRSNNQHEEKLTLKKVFDLVNKDESALKDMNKKLQNMVEETLTKNMHLQKDLEMMSNEVVRLSKLAQKDTNGSNHIEVSS